MIFGFLRALVKDPLVILVNNLGKIIYCKFTFLIVQIIDIFRRLAISCIIALSITNFYIYHCLLFYILILMH